MNLQDPKKSIQIVTAFLLVSIVEGILAVINLLGIPTDPKNAVFMTFSFSRLLIFGLTIFIILILFISFLKIERLMQYFNQVNKTKNCKTIINTLLIILVLSLWFLIWIPSSRLEQFSESYIRIQPTLLFVILVGIQLAITWKILFRDVTIDGFRENGGSNRKRFILVGVFFLTIVLIFLLLQRYAPVVAEGQLYFPPGIPISPMVVLVLIVLCLVILFIEKHFHHSFFNKKIVLLTAGLLIYIMTFLVWNGTNLPCTDDRPGPFPPNYICYPQVNDAVYSIGSHYITLGQGIYNHWLTDKPLYMAFLSLGQVIAGPMIDSYLTFQVAVLALIPAILFLLLRKSFGFSGGIFISFLVIWLGFFQITLYSKIGSVNPKLENPEYLTCFFLLVFGIFLFRWFMDPTSHKWGILSGGILGLSTLIRFNPILIVFTSLPFFWLLNRKIGKKILSGIGLFLIAFCLAVFPWFISANDSAGNNFYWSKIQDVISSRYSGVSSPSIELISPSISSSPETQITVAASTPDPSLSIQSDSQEKIVGNGTLGVVYHFLNNYYTSLAELPVNFSLLKISDITNQDLWDLSVAEPIWKKTFKLENFLAAGCSLLLVLIGIFFAWKKFKWAGLTGLFIQAGYFLGNAFSQTSGGRYLIPVFWVSLIYFSLGIFQMIKWGASFFNISLNDPPKEVLNNQNMQIDIGYSGKMKKSLILTWLILFLVLGSILPILNHIPSKLVDRNDEELSRLAHEKILTVTRISDEQWNVFLSDPKSIIAQGVAYHPRYYTADLFGEGSPSYEMLILTKSNIVVSYMLNAVPENYFSDGSSVIVIGCEVSQDSVWAAERIIVNSQAVLQLDHEGMLYLEPDAIWNCP